MDAAGFLRDFHDHMAPRLDTYEQALYLYVIRHSRLVGENDTAIGFKSARHQIALGIGQSQTAMSETVCYKKLRSLESKGIIEILGTEHAGTRVHARLPEEVPGLMTEPSADDYVPLEELDFFNDQENRVLLMEREDNKCFYCLRAIDSSNFVVEHVVSDGPNSYRNLVAACRQCNNRKGATDVDDFLRTLYREGFLSDTDFQARASHLDRLKNGLLVPPGFE